MAKTTWTLNGRLLLQPQSEIADEFTSPVPLAGVRVKVSAKQFAADPTGWEKWDEGVTDEDGFFSLSNFKNQTRRLFRVRVQFKDDDLKVFPEDGGLLGSIIEAATDMGGVVVDWAEDAIEQALDQFTRVNYTVPWNTVFEAHGSAEKIGPSTVDFGDLVFQAGGAEELGNLNVRRHAEIWYVVKRAMTLLSGYDAGVGFPESKPVAFKYPHDNPWIGDDIEDSYANPHNDTVFLIQNTKKDQFTTATILHELMHLWMYQHCTQEERLMYAIPGGTHDVREDKPHVAFHESFASFTTNEIFRKLFDGKPDSYGAESMRLPFSRGHLVSLGCTDVADADHFEQAWFSLFNMFVSDRLPGTDLNQGDMYAVPHQSVIPTSVPSISFEDFLSCFKPDLPRTSMQLDSFLERVSQTLPQVDTDDADAYRRLLDPNETVQPSEAFPVEMTEQEKPAPDVSPAVSVP